MADPRNKIRIEGIRKTPRLDTAENADLDDEILMVDRLYSCEPKIDGHREAVANHLKRREARRELVELEEKRRAHADDLIRAKAALAEMRRNKHKNKISVTEQAQEFERLHGYVRIAETGIRNIKQQTERLKKVIAQSLNKVEASPDRSSVLSLQQKLT